jgi:hypothetical protein
MRQKFPPQVTILPRPAAVVRFGMPLDKLRDDRSEDIRFASPFFGLRRRRIAPIFGLAEHASRAIARGRQG